MQTRRYKNNQFALTNLTETELQTIKESLFVEIGNGSKTAGRLFQKIFLTPSNQKDFSNGRLQAVNL